MRAHTAWSASLPPGEFKAAVPPNDAAGLVLEAPPTTTAPGLRCSVTFGEARTDTLPTAASWVVRKETRVLDGNLSGGFHATNWLRRSRLVRQP